MNYALVQLILAARNNDMDETSGWMQMLIIVAIAAFYGLSSIIKAKTNKLDDEEELESEQDGSKGAFKPLQLQRPGREVVRSQPTAQKFAAVSELPLPEVEPDFQELPEFTDKIVKELGDKHLGIAPEISQPKVVIEKTLFDLDDPEELRKAILHYEILGKPLSLRSPSEHIT